MTSYICLTNNCVVIDDISEYTKDQQLDFARCLSLYTTDLAIVICANKKEHNNKTDFSGEAYYLYTDTE